MAINNLVHDRAAGDVRQESIRGFTMATLNNIEYKPSFLNNTAIDCNYRSPSSQINWSNNAIPIMSFNIRSMKTNFENFASEILTRFNQFKIIGLCETRLLDSTQNLYPLPNYSLFANNISNDKGGVGIFVHNTIGCNLVPNFCIRTNHLETIFIKCIVRKSVFMVGMIYRRPGTPMISFIEDMNNILHQIRSPCILMGDFNVNLLNESNDNSVKNVVDNLRAFSYIPCVTKPTRVQPNSISLIDHIWVNFDQQEYRTNIIFTGITDHFPISFEYNLPDLPNDKQQISYRKRGEFCDNQFKTAIESSNILDVLLMNDVNEAFSVFSDIVVKVYNESYPLVVKTISQHNLERPWLSSAIKVSIKNKNKLYKKYTKRPVTYGDLYRRYRNLLTKTINQAKNDYYKSKFNESNGNIKDTWKLINKIMGRNSKKSNSSTFKINGSLVDDPNTIADSFNNYYCTIGTKTANALPVTNNNFRDYLPNVQFADFNWVEITENDIKRIINKSKDSKPGPDEIPMFIYKKNIDLFSPIITHLCNISLRSGIFPSNLKTGIVIPIFKSKEKDNIINYRPICLEFFR